MNFNKMIQDIKPHLLVVLAFFMVGYLYYKETFNGKIHKEDDVTQGLLKGTELKKYTDANGDFPGWTNSIFSGMPSTLIKGKVSGNYVKSYNYLTPFSHTAYPFQILFLSFIGFYILMNSFKIKPLYGALAAIAYGFATYSISSVEAAHYTKVLAMALMPAVLASLQWLFNGKYLLGGVTLAFNMALQVYYFHYQITFYTILCMLTMGIYYLVVLIKQKKTKQLILASLISVVAVGAGVTANVTKIIITSKFADNTMRGGNDMAKANTGYKQKETGKNGLNRDYAFDWSYGKGETFTLLIPGLYGGSSVEKIGENSKFYEATQGEYEQAPLYFGDLTFTSGPIYIGAIIVFLFFLGMVVVKDTIKWPILIMTIISFILGWGKHFAIINDFLFDHLPYFNKFRTPMMAFCIAQVTMPLMGFLGLKTLYDNWKVAKAAKPAQDKSAAVKVPVSLNDQQTWKYIKYTFFAVGGFCLLMALMGPSFMDLEGAGDARYREGGNSNIIPILKEDRASLVKRDSFRSFLYIAAVFGLLWAWYSEKLKKNAVMIAIGALAAIDLIGVDWRYLSWDDFQFERGTVTDVAPDNADKEIMADKDPHFRVLDLTSDPFNDNSRAAFHKLIGGYDPAKLSRYQDVISELISKREYQDKALDMLNCKYLIGSDSLRGTVSFRRQSAMGNAWFVESLNPAANAIEDMNQLKQEDIRKAATFDKSFEANKKLQGGKFMLDSTAYVRLTRYHPDTLVYDVNNANDGYLVFSEIYYEDWKADIDGQPTDVNKVNYTLRGLAVKGGHHTVKLYFNKGQNATDKIEKGMSIAILVGMLALIVQWLMSYFKKETQAANQA